MWISGGIIAIVGCVVVLILRRKQITLDFVYIKNKKIGLFPKPVVIGAVSIKIDDERISRAGQVVVPLALLHTGEGQNLSRSGTGQDA